MRCAVVREVEPSGAEGLTFQNYQPLHLSTSPLDKPSTEKLQSLNKVKSSMLNKI